MAKGIVVHTYTSVTYAITLTLRPHMYRLNPEIQYDHTYLEIMKTIKDLNTTCYLIAELNKNFNVHYHGKIQFHTKEYNHMFKFKNAFRSNKYIGYVDIRQVTDDKGWDDYLSKELVKTKTLLDRPPIIIDDFEACIELNGMIQAALDS